MLAGTEFIRDSLWIRYRASADPQRVDIHVRTTGAMPVAVEYGRVFMRRVIDTIELGAAGGSLFDPAAGSAKLVAAPPEGEALGPDYVWSAEVAGVSPRALRTMVEHLRHSGGGFFPVTSMSITGSLPTDRSELSVTEEEVKRWLRDPEAYIDAWPEPGFPVTPREVSSGAAIRVTLADEITPELSDALRTALIAWVNVTSEYVADTGEHIRVGNSWEMLPVFGMGRHELRARYRQFPRRKGPSRDALVNMIARFHRTTAKVEELSVGL